MSSVTIKHPGPEEDLRWCHQGNNCFTVVLVVWKACCLTCVRGDVIATRRWSREYPTSLEPQPCHERTLCVFPDWHSLWCGHNNMTRVGWGSGPFVWHPLPTPLGSDIVWIFSTFLSGDLALKCPPQPYRSSDSSHPQEWGEWGEQKEKKEWIESLRGKERGGGTGEERGFSDPRGFGMLSRSVNDFSWAVITGRGIEHTGKQACSEWGRLQDASAVHEVRLM